MVEFAYRTEL